MEITAIGRAPSKPTLIVFEAVNGIWRITAPCGHQLRVVATDQAEPAGIRVHSRPFAVTPPNLSPQPAVTRAIRVYGHA